MIKITIYNTKNLQQFFLAMSVSKAGIVSQKEPDFNKEYTPAPSGQ